MSESSKSVNSDRVRLQHMLDAAREAVGYVKGRNRDDLDRDSMLLHALIHCLSVIGEAAVLITHATRNKDTSVPWKQIVGMRNRLIHAYFDIDHDEVWRTITEDLPVLIERIQSLCDSMPAA